MSERRDREARERRGRREVRITLPVRRIIWVLAAGAAVLAVLTVAAQTFRIAAEPPLRNLFGLVTLLDVRKEESLHTWYSEMLLLFAAGLLAVVWLLKRREGSRYVRHWAGLSALLIFLSVDEGASVHEKLGNLGRFMLGTAGISPTGFLAYAWIVPAFFLVLLVAVLYAGFFFHLQNRERILFATSVVLFVGASIFLEALSAFYVSYHGGQQGMTLLQIFGVIGITTAEETTEVVAVIVLIYALLTYLRLRIEGLTLGFKESPSRSSRAS